MKIKFREINEQYGFLSNFFYATLNLKGKEWRTVEHYFQAQKFAGTEHEEDIRLAKYPREAKMMGQSRQRPLRTDWEGVKYEIMKEANRAKFSQHPKLLEKLLNTGDAYLLEDAPWDPIWGSGEDGKGKNLHGKILMELRDEFRSGMKKVCPIYYLIGDATEPKGEGHKLIAHICNNYGGWGRGFVVALSNKWKAPENDYRKGTYKYDLGATRGVPVERDISVVNMVAQEGNSTKENPVAVRYDHLNTCLQTLADMSLELNATVHMPRIGCGLGEVPGIK